LIGLILVALGCSGDKTPGDTQAADDTSATDTQPIDTQPVDTDTGPCEPFAIYYDGDGDGHGDPNVAQKSCEVLDGWSELGDDCDDGDSSIWEDCPTNACTLVFEREHLEDADTGDTAAPEVTGTSLYWICEEKMGWQAGRQHCFDELGADLAAFEKPGELEDFQLYSSKNQDKESMWIGLSQADGSPTEDFGWSWINGLGTVEGETLAEGGVWHEGEPNNGGYSEGGGGEFEEDVAAWVRNAGTWGIMDVIVDQDKWPICEVTKTGE